LGWYKKRLGEVVTLKRGYDLPASQRLPGAVPVVSSSGVTGTHNEAKAKAPGVVTGRYGTLGEVFYIAEDFWPLNTALYVEDFKGNHPRFIAYFLKQAIGGASSDKAAVPGINRNDLHARQVLFPNLASQVKIADILSAYDDLIENNRRRIQLLEQSARLLYKEWFVRLRFPGHEHLKIKDGVPEGWKLGTIADLGNIVTGKTPARVKRVVT
jgi:type I restriction enzyme, S subunit